MSIGGWVSIPVPKSWDGQTKDSRHKNVRKQNKVGSQTMQLHKECMKQNEMEEERNEEPR